MTAIEFNHQLMGMQSKLGFFAKSLTSDQEDAKDLLQETLYKALTNRDKFQGGKNLKAWVFTIMKNTFINNYRRNVRFNTLIDSTDNSYYLNLRTESVFQSPEACHNEKEIRTAISELPEDYRLPFEMQTKGYKYKEIAEYLNQPLGSVKSKIFFARKRLMERLKDFR
ncbi:MAG: RNA polymerase sigma factor [Porphyromonadaceae bacterium]|nr:MAG: RNA polymerase sigma factor [Porphyromonadaceae bacterium]